MASNVCVYQIKDSCLFINLKQVSCGNKNVDRFEKARNNHE